MSLLDKRKETLNDLLAAEDGINLDELRKFCFNGVPDCNGFRPLCWKLLLGYLSPKKSTWSKTLDQKRRLYRQFIQELIVDQGSSKEGHEDQPDHPLSETPGGAWNTYWKDNEVLLQIDKDVRRLCPDISFFQQATEFPCQAIVGHGGGPEARLHSRVKPVILSSANVERRGLEMTKEVHIKLISKVSPESYNAMQDGKEAHWEVVERILFVFAKLNPGINYVQGMNEIVGPIYYVMASDPNSDYREHAEADSFFCFSALMSEMKDFFIKTLDESDSGIKSMMNRLAKTLESVDSAVFARLKEQDLHLQFYGFRWLTLLLSQEFPLPDVVRIWDAIFSDKNRFQVLIQFCCAMIVLVRRQILEQDFASNVKLLQNYPSTDINLILAKATAIK